MSIVIVTNKCYIVCDAINYVNLEEHKGDSSLKMWEINRKSGKLLPEKERMYKITIDFLPAAIVATRLGNSSTDTVTFAIRGKNDAEDLFKHIVNQLREQIPDTLHLNDLIADFLNQKDT